MRVLAIDDHPLLQEIIPAVVRKALGDVDVATASTLEDGMRQAHAEPPELALLDLGLPGCAGLDAVLRFRKSFPRLRVVVVSSDCEHHLVAGALEIGAVGFIPKTSKPEVMVAALQLIAAGGTYVPPAGSLPGVPGRLSLP